MQLVPPNVLALCSLLIVIAAVRPGSAQAPGDAPDIARGRHLATAVAGCADCHGANFAGGRTFERGGVPVRAANLTGGAGGIAQLSDADLRRAIRAGIAPDGRRLVLMPAREYAVMTDRDMDDVIAFLRALPPVDNVIAPPPAPAGTPAHDAPGGAPPEDTGSTPLPAGAYLARIGGCTNCHGADLAGGRVVEGVAVPAISHAGIGSWSFADFRTAMRTGITPAGRMLSGVMPWRTAGQMTDDELQAIYDYLQSAPGAGARAER